MLTATMRFACLPLREEIDAHDIVVIPEERHRQRTHGAPRKFSFASPRHDAARFGHT
jgi:hypothetical protein